MAENLAKPDRWHGQVSARVHEAWKATVSRASNARYTHVPESGHYMPNEAHTVVVTTILEMFESIASGRR
jgi:hypothetical protein